MSWSSGRIFDVRFFPHIEMRILPSAQQVVRGRMNWVIVLFCFINKIESEVFPWKKTEVYELEC